MTPVVLTLLVLVGGVVVLSFTLMPLWKREQLTPDAASSPTLSRMGVMYH